MPPHANIQLVNVIVIAPRENVADEAPAMRQCSLIFVCLEATTILKNRGNTEIHLYLLDNNNGFKLKNISYLIS